MALDRELEKASSSGEASSWVASLRSSLAGGRKRGPDESEESDTSDLDSDLPLFLD